ncbi:hypothetical protein [Microvirga vignae]|nr:hypothetical protein [Microvirga vignae]
MRFLVAALIGFSFALPLPVKAQTERLPLKSRSERRVEELNRDMQQERRIQSLEQDFRLKNGQIRQDIERQRIFSSPPITSPYRCSPGAVRC